MTMISGMFGRGNGAGSLYASELVVVTGQDKANLDLRLRPGVSVSGTVVFEGSDGPPHAGVDRRSCWSRPRNRNRPSRWRCR